ncbi:MAG: hypothetical protein IKF19_02775 [Bacilli bacterium]|nr:hypothetical protein [Bacilli bacterium]
MEGNVFKQIINNIKNKMHKNNHYPNDSEYAFSTEEITILSKENKEKMLALKNNTFKRKKEDNEPNNDKELQELILDNLNNDHIPQKQTKDILDDDDDKDKITYTKIVKKLNGELKEEKPKPPAKYTNLTDELQEKINKAIDKVDMIVLDNFIMRGKELVEQNYNIKYGEESLKFIYQTRHEFEVLIEYLIGFNNEKKGIYNKTTFSNNLDDEWKYLNNYIKILEQIKSIKEK